MLSRCVKVDLGALSWKRTVWPHSWLIRLNSCDLDSV